MELLLCHSIFKSALAGAFLLLLAPAGAAQAQPSQPEPGILHQVVELERGETLPLFQQPGGDGGSVGELRRKTRDVVLSGASMQVDGRVWHEIVHNGSYAWAEAVHLEPQGETRASSYPLQCLGTEPFWSVSIREDAVFEAPDIAQTIWTASDWMPAQGPIGRYMIRLSSGYGTGYLALLKQACSDGMSDTSYPFEAIMITPGQAVRAGCCRRTWNE